MKNESVAKRSLPSLSSVAALFSGIVFSASITNPAHGDFQFIAELTPDPQTQVTPGIRGLTFDGGPNPLVLDGTTWRLARLDVSTGAVIESSVLSPRPSTPNRSLAYDAASGDYFTDSLQDFALINKSNNSATELLENSQAFGVASIAINPVDGELWLSTSDSNGQLWKIDKSTGEVTFHRTFGVFGGDVLSFSALAISPSGEFFVAGDSVDGYGIYKIDPDTGGVEFKTSLDFASNTDFLLDFDYSPATGRWYGIAEVRSESPREYHYIEITGIPEPGSVALVLGSAVALLQRRRS